MHVNIVHASANTRALRLSPLAQLPLLLPLLSRSPPSGAAGRSYIPAMPAAPLRNHAKLTAHPKLTSCPNCALINARTRQDATGSGGAAAGGHDGTTPEVRPQRHHHHRQPLAPDFP